MSRGTLDPAIQKFSFKYVALTLSGRPSHAVLLENFLHVAVRNPGDKSPVWALSLSLAATKKIDFSFSSSRYLDVSVP